MVAIVNLSAKHRFGVTATADQAPTVHYTASIATCIIWWGGGGGGGGGGGFPGSHVVLTALLCKGRPFCD